MRSSPLPRAEPELGPEKIFPMSDWCVGPFRGDCLFSSRLRAVPAHPAPSHRHFACRACRVPAKDAAQRRLAPARACGGARRGVVEGRVHPHADPGRQRVVRTRGNPRSLLPLAERRRPAEAARATHSARSTPGVSLCGGCAGADRAGTPVAAPRANVQRRALPIPLRRGSLTPLPSLEMMRLENPNRARVASSQAAQVPQRCVGGRGLQREQVLREHRVPERPAPVGGVR